MNETALFRKVMPMPNRTSSLKGKKKCSRGKCRKDRVTVLLACNMDGSSKVFLLTMGRYAKPCFFKNIETLLVSFESIKKARMNADIFQN